MNDFFNLVKERLEKSTIEFKEDFDREMRAIVQEIILSGLSRTDFFENNVFHGGTALRLVYGLNRYSDDLDFNMRRNDLVFSWKPYIDFLEHYAKGYGCTFEFKEEDLNNKKVVKTLNVKDNFSITDMIHNKGIVNVQFTHKKSRTKPKIRIDTSFQVADFTTEKKTLLFPIEYEVEVFDIYSMFAGKINALLTREKTNKDTNTKERVDYGRDWFDFIWYVNHGVLPDFSFLSKKLKAKGTYKDQNIPVDLAWVKKQLMVRMRTLDYATLNKQIIDLTTLKNRITLHSALLIDAINRFGRNNIKGEKEIYGT